MTPKIKIACPHITDKVPTDKVVSDYHPLTEEEIYKLLITASSNRGDAVAISEIQVRLDQGIVGITCPRPITGNVAKKLNELDRTFIEDYEKRPTHNTADKLYKIMTRK